MNTIFRGDIVSKRGRRNAWLDALVVDHAALRLIWRNFGKVVPGRLYRSNHPTPGQLASSVRRYGIRTVVNLRGACGNGSDALSRAEAHRLGLQFVDVPLRSRVPPSREVLSLLVDTIGTAPMEPILVHCKSGADRAGFAAGVFLLLNGGTASDALGQLSLRHGHIRAARAGVLGDVFRRYRDTAEGRLGFAQWARMEYTPNAFVRTVRKDWSGGRFADVLNDRVLGRE